MRIVHIAPFFHPVIGGMEGVVWRICKYLSTKGHEVHVITYNRTRTKVGGLPMRQNLGGVGVTRVKPTLVWGYGSYSPALPEEVLRLGADVVHVHGWRHPHVFQVAKLKHRLGFKAVLQPYAPFYGLTQTGLLLGAYYVLSDDLLRGAIRSFDTVVALSPSEKKILMDRLKVPEERIRVISPGLDEGLLAQAGVRQPSKKNQLLYVGRIARSKNIDLLVRSLSYVGKRDIRLLLAGPDEGYIKSIIGSRHESKITYVGTVSEQRKLFLYAECYVFVHPALYEGFGITLLEAQAFGKPCVVTGQGGQLYSAPPGKTSVYALPTPSDFGNAITSLLDDDTLYRRLSNNAREWAVGHSWARLLPLYEKVYDQT